MPLFTEDVPELDGKGLEAVIRQTNRRGAFQQPGVPCPGLTDTGQIAFDIRQEHRHSATRKLLGENLQ